MTPFTFNSLFCWQITLTLLHVSWVGLLIGLLSAASNRVMKDMAASHRHSVNFTALVMFAASLPVSFAIVRSGTDAVPVTVPMAWNSHEESTVLILHAIGTSSSASQSASDIGSESDVPHASISSGQPATISTQAVTFRTPSVWDRVRSIGRSAAPFVAVLYLFGVTLMFIKLAIGVRVSRRLRSGSVAMNDPTVLSRMADQGKKLSLRIMPVIALCEQSAVPIVVGLLRPMILVPAAMVNGLTIEQLESVLTHELAHLHRRDHLMIVVQRVLEAMLFFHPVTWYLSHRIHDERETSCDDLVLAVGGDRLQYAQSLLRVAELRFAVKSRQQHLSLAADGQRPSKLRQRIARLLEDSDGNSVRVSRVWPIVSLIAASGIGYWLMYEIASPAIADETKPSAAIKATPDKDQDPAAIDLPPLRLPDKTEVGVPQDTDDRALPPGMIQRFGSARFRSGATAWQSAAFSADGEWIWCKADGLTVMHRKTGHVIKGVDLGLDRNMGVTSVAISPGGTLVAVAGMIAPAIRGEVKVSENRVVLFDSNSGTKMSTIEWQGALGGVSYLAISHDESTLLTGEYQGDVRLWNLASGKESGRIAVGLEFKAGAFSPDGGRVVLVGSIRSFLWSPGEDGPPKPLSPIVRHQMAVCYSPDGKYFATGCWGEEDGVRLWDGKTGELVARLVANGTTAHADGGLAFTPDSRILAAPAISADGVELWDDESRKLLVTLPVKNARAVAISRDGKWLAAIGGSQRVQIFDLKTQTEMNPKPQKELNAITVGHLNQIVGIRFTNPGRVLTSDHNGLICLWDARSGEQLFRTESAMRVFFNGAMAVSPDGQTLVLNPMGEKMAAFNANTGELRHSFPGHGRFGGTRAVQFARDGKTFVSWGDDQVLRRWNVPDGNEMLSGESVAIVVPGYVYDPNGGRRELPKGWFAYSGQSLFVAYKGILREYDARDGAVIRQVEIKGMRNLMASPDGRWVATVDDVQLDGGLSQSTISLRDASTLQPVHQWIPGADASKARIADPAILQFYAGELSFSPDSGRIAWMCSGQRGAAEVADVNTKKILAHIPLSATGLAVEFSPDGTQLAIGNKDTTIGLWDLSTMAVVPADGDPKP